MFDLSPLRGSGEGGSGHIGYEPGCARVIIIPSLQGWVCTPLIAGPERYSCDLNRIAPSELYKIIYIVPANKEYIKRIHLWWNQY